MNGLDWLELHKQLHVLRDGSYQQFIVVNNKVGEE